MIESRRAVLFLVALAPICHGFQCCSIHHSVSPRRTPHQTHQGLYAARSSSSASASPSAAAAAATRALERTASQLNRLQQRSQRITTTTPTPAESSAAQEVEEEETTNPEELYESFLRQPANTLKQQLKERRLPTKGRKPDLAQRLVDFELKIHRPMGENEEEVIAWDPSVEAGDDKASSSSSTIVNTFAGLRLSVAAGKALGKAKFQTPSAIQKAVIPLHSSGESLIMHAETGSGKTLAYLLPITEQMWVEHNAGVIADGQYQEEGVGGCAFIMTPTRELAAQVAGVATVLAPPGTVRLVSRPTNLMHDGLKERGEEEYGGRLDKSDGRTKQRLFVGSAKAIMHSLYGDGKMPASPTTKPEAMQMLRNVRWVVLDEVDRLLEVKKTHRGSQGVGGGGKATSPRHEKPAAIVTSAVARMTFGKSQVVAASATVGRSLRRELSRVLGLSPQESPQVVRATNANLNDDDDDDNDDDVDLTAVPGKHVGRAVTIPDTVQHYVMAVDTSSTGKLLTSAVYVLKGLRKTKKNKRILMVLSKGCGINTKNTIGALKQFQCQPEPMSLLDVLEADGTDRMIQVHREVTGATGVGEAYFSPTDPSSSGMTEEDEEENADEGYLLVTGEDTVRGLHLDSLDVVLVVGRANGPDEYTHIAGRTGRAGKMGKVINILSLEHAAAVSGWETMLGVAFQSIDMDGIAEL